MDVSAGMYTVLVSAADTYQPMSTNNNKVERQSKKKTFDEVGADSTLGDGVESFGEHTHSHTMILRSR